jgi:uncharacterized protein YkwD
MAAWVTALSLLALAQSATAQTQTFSGGSPVTFSGMSGSPYPSTLDVSGMGGTISDVNVTLTGVTLTATNMDLLLVSPNGLATLLTSDVPTTGVLSQNWTYDDEAAAQQESNQLTGIFRTTNLDGGLGDTDTLPAPAPADADGQLLNFDSSAPNGTWKLFAANSLGLPPIGSIGGWSLTLTTVTGITDSVPASKDYGSNSVGTISPQSFTVTNVGDAAMAITSTSIQGADAPDFLLGADTCLTATLAPAATCVVQVAFKPVTEGAKTATLVLGSDTGGPSLQIPLSGLALAAPISEQQQQPPPGSSEQGIPPGSTQTGSNDVGVETVRFDAPTTVGQPTTLHVEASDDKEPVTGLIVDFGEKLGLYGASACVEGATGGNSTAFDVPYRFLTPGRHTIKVTIFSGGCGKPSTRTVTFTMDVAPANAARRLATAADTIVGPDITSKCKNASMVPSKRKAGLVTKALLCVMNEQRRLAKLKPLKLSKKLGKAAVAHTKAMISGKFFAHQGPKEKALGARLKKAKYRGAAGENIGAGAGVLASPVQMVNGWMHSTLHRANLLSRQWKTVGIGFVAGFPLSATQPSATFTTDFGVRP